MFFYDTKWAGAHKIESSEQYNDASLPCGLFKFCKLKRNVYTVETIFP